MNNMKGKGQEESQKRNNKDFQGQNRGRGGNNNGNNSDNNNRNWNKNDKSTAQLGPHDGYFLCEGDHYATRCHPWNAPRNGPKVQHQIHEAMDHRQAKFQATPLQLTGKLYGCEVSILINTNSRESFVDPSVVS